MTSPLISGNFVGWTTDDSDLHFYSGTHDAPPSYSPHGLRRPSQTVATTLLSPVLTGTIDSGAQVSVLWYCYALRSLTIECLDATQVVVATTTESATDTATTTTLVVPAETQRIRLTLGGGDPSTFHVSALEVPGLVLEDVGVTLPSTNALPAGWVMGEGQFTFSYAGSVDSGDGNGSIMAVSATGGIADMTTHTFSAVENRFYTLRARQLENVPYSLNNVTGHWEAFTAEDEPCGYGDIMEALREDGSWATFGFTLSADTSYLKIFVHGAPDLPVYIDAISLPAAPGVVFTSADVTCPMATVASAGGPTSEHGAAALTGARVTMRAYGGAQVSLRNPAPTIAAASGGHARLSAPKPSLSALGHDSTGEQAAYLTAPSPTLAVATGANAKSIRPRAPQLSTAGTVTTLAAASLVAPSAVLTSGGTVAAMAVAALSPPSPNLIGYGGAVVSVALAGGPTLQVAGTTGGVAGVTVAAPLFQLSSAAAQQNHGSVDILAPSPRMGGTLQAWLVAPVATLTAIGSATITATYEAYAVNLNHSPRPNEQIMDEATRYTNFPFTHVVRYQNSYYGANSTGLYLLEGTTDDGAPIPWAFKTAMTDFNTPNKKTLASAYFSGRFGPASTIRLIEGEKTPNTYSFTTPRGTLAQNHRQKFGKGTKGRYYALSVSGTGECELDGIEPEVHQLTRRI